MSDFWVLVASFGLLSFFFFDTAKTLFKKSLLFFSIIFYIFALLLFLPILGLTLLNMSDEGAIYSNLGIFLVVMIVGILIALMFYAKVISPTFRIASLGMEFGIIKDELKKRKLNAKT